jgi:hypothetical protein
MTSCTRLRNDSHLNRRYEGQSATEWTAILRGPRGPGVCIYGHSIRAKKLRKEQRQIDDPIWMRFGPPQAARNCSTRTKRGGFGPALTPTIKVSSPLLHAGGFFFWIQRMRWDVDPAHQVLAFSEGPGAQIWPPIAVRTFFEGPEEPRT